MFRTLASFNEGFSPHSNYITKQQTHYDARPNMVPSATSGLKGFDNAIRTAPTYDSTDYQEYAVKNPNDIFMPTETSNLTELAKRCASSDLDTLINDKNPTERIGCGWLYTAPNRGSTYPIVSRGALGHRDGAFDAFDIPAHRKWFFDLQEAKRQTLLDKCKALTTCTNVENAEFNGVCGFCSDINQGIPLDSRYQDKNSSMCNVITKKDACPKPNPNGPQPIMDRTCEPQNGVLSRTCLRQQVLSAGCDRKGTLATALLDADESRNLAKHTTVTIYNRVANPPFNASIFVGGKTTVDNVLREVRQLAGNTSKLDTSAIGAAARDLCLQRGAIEKYDACNDLSDSSAPPHNMTCLQQVFLKMGGNQRGTLHPSNANVDFYNGKGTIGQIKQHLMERIETMKNTNGGVPYNEQKEALIQMIGIRPEDVIIRAPYKQGVEVFWFTPTVMNPRKVGAFLKRTIEPKIVTFNDGPSKVPQIGNHGYGVMLQLADIRAPSDATARLQVRVDDGFWVAVNYPPEIDEYAFTQVAPPGSWTAPTMDKPGFFSNMGLQGPTAYNSWAGDISLNSSTPNIMKLYHQDAGGGWAAFGFTGTNILDTNNGSNRKYLSLTCEHNAPFLTFEVSKRSKFEELRNPGIFAQFTTMIGVDVRTRTDEKASVPGKNSFARLSTARSIIDLKNIAFQSWKTITIPIRILSMSTNMETIIALACGPNYYFNVVVLRNGQVQVWHNVQNRATLVTNINAVLAVNQWYLFKIDNLGTGFTITCNLVSDVIANNGSMHSTSSMQGNQAVWKVNETWTPTPGQNYGTCNIMLGTATKNGWYGMVSSAAFTFDVTWVHFFDRIATPREILRDCNADWKYTQFPTTFNTYN